MKKIFCTMACLLVLTGCVTKAPPAQILPDITFQHLTPLSLAAQGVSIKDVRLPVQAGTDVSLRFPTPPEQALRTWAQHRLAPTRTSADTAVLTIIDAVAIEEPLTRTEGIKGLFTTSQSDRYTVKIAAQLELFAPDGFRRGIASAQVSRFITMAEDATLLEREKAWFSLVEQAMADFDKTMAKNITEKLR